MDDFIVEKIRKEIEHFASHPVADRAGTVVKVGDGVVELTGLPDAVMSEMIVFDESEGKPLNEALRHTDALYGMVLNLEEESVKAVVLGDTSRIVEGMTARRTGKVLSIPVGDALVGRVVSPLGEPIDGRGEIPAESHYRIEREAYGVIDRESVNTPLHTGIKAIDGMIPIGRGQRELIIGDRFTGKTTIAIDTILNQKNEPPATRPICIYVAIGQKESKTARIMRELSERGALEYTVIVNAGASAPAALQFLAPYAGAAIGEFFMEKGRDALVVYDDLSKQAVAYRQLSLLLRRPPGREAYPGDIFYLHSRLLERAAKLSKEKGGGSLTALPIIETQEGDVSAYIPTNVISITDGQIFLDTGLFNRGLRPAINVGISVSRVGSAAQTKAMKKVAGKLRLELAQFRDLEAFAQFAQDLDPETKKQLDRGSRLTGMLTQGKHMPMGFEQQVPIMYAGVNGYLARVRVEDLAAVEEKLISYIETHTPEFFDALRERRELGDELEAALKETLGRFTESHADLFSLQN